ncbi:MAG: lipid A-modifier LpxR family protein [Pseudomonadota bacterium]
MALRVVPIVGHSPLEPRGTGADREVLMRGMAAFAIALGSLGGGAASAQTLTRDLTAEILNSAAFTPREAYAAGEGPVEWRSGELRLSDDRAGPVDTVRVNIGGILHTPGGLPLNPERGAFDADTLDITLVRHWPGAMRFASDGLEVDVVPHAGFGVSSFGGQAEGGATVTVSKSRTDRAVERLRDMGVRDGAGFGDTGRWYLFAAASGRAVGLNMLRGERGWDRAGWSTDDTGALVGDAQIGVGWRKGDMQSSFGVIHREVRGKHMVFGQETRDDTVAAFTFSFRPQR